MNKDANAAAVPAAGTCSSPSGAAASARSNNQTSEAWYEHASSSSSSSGSQPGGAAHQQGRQRSNVCGDWFKHDDGCGHEPAWPPGPDQMPSAKVHHQRRNDEAKRQMIGGHDPNDWYRHDHGPNDAHAVEPLRPGKKMSSPEKRLSSDIGFSAAQQQQQQQQQHGGAAAATDASNSMLWFAHDDGRQGDAAVHDGDTSIESPRNRHTDPEADSYYQRDKTGSGADWFPHEHSTTDRDHPGAANAAGRERPGTGAGPAARRESDEIARRLKVESEDWYSNDPASAAAAAASASESSPTRGCGRLGITPEVRRMIERDSGDEVRQILRVDENVGCR